MKTKYELTYKPLWGFLKWYGLFLLIILILGPTLYEWKYGNGIGEIGVFYRNMIGFVTLIFIPNLILIFQYNRENRNTDFTIDKRKKLIEINHKGKLNSYRIEDIKSSIYQRNTYSKDLMWQVFSYADLGYCDLTFTNGDRYFLTTYLIDINKKPLFDNTEIKHSIFPSIDKTDPKTIAQKAEKQTEKRIEKLKSNFRQKSESELREILNSKNKYQEDAIKAAEQLLKN